MAARTIAPASKADGLKAAACFSYTSSGIRHSRLIHSALRHTVPSGRVYSPSRLEYAPKWMNIPKRP